MQAIVVITTVGTEQEANSIARELVSRRLAACVNILPQVRSVYRWQGSICKDSELMLIIKSSAGEFDQIRETIGELHSYDLPEILAFNVAEGDAGFLGWIAASLDKEAEFEDEGEDFVDPDSDD